MPPPSVYTHINVEAALKENKEKIAQIRKLCSTEIALDSSQYDDDIFLVRFLLSSNSKGDVPLAVTNVKSTIAWRQKHKDILAKCKNGFRHPDEVELTHYVPFAVHYKHDGSGTFATMKDGSPLLLVRSGHANPGKAFDALGKERIVSAMMFNKEIVMHHCDAETRKRGYFVKVVSVNDMTGLCWSSLSRNFMNSVGEAAGSIDKFFPLLLGSTVIFSPPSFMSMIWPIAKAVLPAATLEKMKVCKAERGANIYTCPYVSKVFDLDQLPQYLGGTCSKCAQSGGCAMVPNYIEGTIDGTELARMDPLKMHRWKFTVKLKPKSYVFRLRILFHGVPIKEKYAQEGETERLDFIIGGGDKKQTVELDDVEIGPILLPLPSGKETTLDNMKKYFLYAITEKLVSPKNPETSAVSESKEKKEEIEINPLKLSSAFIKGKTIKFGDTCDIDVSIEEFMVEKVSSPLRQKFGSTVWVDRSAVVEEKPKAASAVTSAATSASS